MSTQPDQKIERMATDSIMLGLISLLFAFPAFLWGIQMSGSYEYLDGGGVYFYFLCIGPLPLVSLVAGLWGFGRATRAIRRNREEVEDKKIKKMATLGLIFNTTGIVLVLIVFYYIYIR